MAKDKEMAPAATEQENALLKTPAANSPEAADLKAQLAAAQAKLSATEQENALLKTENRSLSESDAGSSMGSFPRSMATTTTKPTYKFRVAVVNEPKLPMQDILAVDESEAMRLYAVRNGSSGRALDTVKFRWKVECLEAGKRREAGKRAQEKRHADAGLEGATVVGAN